MLYPYISVIDGFKFTSFLDPRKNDSFLIEGCLTPEQADYINSHHIKSVTTKYMKEFDSLKQCPGIESICIGGKTPYGKDVPVESWTYEPSGLYNLPNLKVLQISVDENDKLVIDLKGISTLEGLRYYRNKRCINLDKAVNLKWLEIWHYREKNLMELKNLKKLKYLNLTWASIQSLEGCEFLESLEELRLYYNRSLKDISALQGNADTFAFWMLKTADEYRTFRFWKHWTIWRHCVYTGGIKFQAFSLSINLNIWIFSFLISMF